MKKELVLPILFIILLSFISIQASAADSIEGSLDQIENTKSKVDSGIEKIADTPENIKNKFLTKAWGEMIAKNRIIGPIHKIFSQYPLPFIILFAHPYEISLTFFCIFFLWLFIAIAVSKQIKATEAFGAAGAFFLSVIVAIIVAQTGLIKLIVVSLLSLIFSKELWWARLLISAIIIALILALGYINGLIAKNLKVAREKRKKEAEEEKVEKMDNFIKGVEEGQKLKDELKGPKSKSDYLFEAAKRRR